MSERARLLLSSALLVLAGCPEGHGNSPEGTLTTMSEDALRALSDEFEGPQLRTGWTVLNQTTFRLTLAEGALRMEPTQNVVWWKADRGPGVVQLLRGNFKATTRVHVRSVSDPSKPPGHDYQFGGLIARDPRSDEPAGKENYVFSVIGYRGSYLSAETKSTRDSQSEVAGPPWDSGSAELRICRLGSSVALYDRKLGSDTWHLAITYRRPDLPAELQVGPIAYALSNHPDVRADFEWVRFAPARSRSDCERD
ncbi:MAG: hypothetical protein RMK29_18285 [Myxococcales bacterium]|nr:hypothetical protein [Myxococcota bacterium]MDW8283661.1 hypothetical protein [Myxococcales bacterium]